MSARLFGTAAALTALIVGCTGNKPVPDATPAEPLVAAPDAPASPPPAPFVCEDEGLDWPMFQREQRRQGTTEAPPLAKPTIAWSKEVGIASWLNNPLIAGGRVYVPSSGQVWNRPDGSDGLHAFDLQTGQHLWFAPTDDDANGAAYEGCRVFVGSDAGAVKAIDARSGEELWTATVGAKAYTNPLPLGSIVVVGGALGQAAEGEQAQGVITALDAATGEPIWRHTLDSAVRGGAAADDDRVYITTEDGHLLALALSDGMLKWKAKLDGQSAYGVPTLGGEDVFVGFVRDTYYNVPAVSAFERDSGSKRWQATNSQGLDGGWGNIRSSPALVDGRLIWGEPYSNRIVALDVGEGDVTASIAAGFCTFPHWPSPAVAQHLVYVPRHDGGLYAYDTEQGGLSWKLYLGDSQHVSAAFPPEHQEGDGNRCQWDPPFGKPIFASPAIAADGTVLIATGDGWLHALREAE